MEFDVSYEDGDSYLFVHVEGKWTEANVNQGLLEFTERLQQQDKTRVLLDMRQVSAPPTEFHRFLAGEAIVKVIGYKYRVAVLYPGELINKFVEDVAVNRGANLIVLADFDKAVAWLIKD